MSLNRILSRKETVYYFLYLVIRPSASKYASSHYLVPDKKEC